ncbi:hypothetical protein NC653_000080 [Populus alba x Populus x berolinensis]|uniref:Uncharacterized protein n=1 Tax=Populus alba x Populus x berolinensis TaxID=444605 RepID=A0AAD6WEF8_9ROSI|nr:hypothetical protein NC653_000080 [Populus alba x Populus x berolinensis]
MGETERIGEEIDISYLEVEAAYFQFCYSHRFLYSGEASEYLPCWKSHYHVPQSAFTSLMKVFVNMKSLKIKLCPFPSLISCYGVHHGHAFTVKLMEEGTNNKILSIAGSLSLDDEGMFYLEKIENSLILSFSVVILCHQPKTLSRAVTLSAGIQGHSSEVNKSWPMNLQNLVYWLKKHEENKHHLGEKLWLVHKWKGERCNVNKLIVEERHSYGSEGKAQYRSEGNVFMESEQVARFRALSSKTRVDESWLKDPQNLVCWLENHEENKHQLAEKLWLIHKWKERDAT